MTSGSSTAPGPAPVNDDPAHGDVVISLVFGLAFTATGLLLRRRDPVG